MKSKQHVKRKKRDSEHRILFAYYVVVFLFMIGLTVPEGRVWGFNWWAYQHALVKILFIALALSIGPLMLRWSRYVTRTNLDTVWNISGGKAYFVFSIIIFVLWTTLFITFPATTHFLGDGYQLLSRLADQVQPVKFWDVGASLVNTTIFGLVVGAPEARALTTYQIIAVISGIIMIITVSLAASILFSDILRRCIFLLGIISGGYTLLFFGYVENYALFTVMILIFTILGLLASLKKIHRWWAIIPVVVASALHIFGLTLIPALFFLLFHDKISFSRYNKMTRKGKSLVFIVGILIVLFIYEYMRQRCFFFKFALLPLIPDQFTIENDYLFSLKHVIDIFNLIILLVPGFFTFLAFLVFEKENGFFKTFPGRFLFILTLSTFVTVYVFNPGIGMPRNWDLFSLLGVPMAVMIYYYFLSASIKMRSACLISSLAIALSLFSLIPRVISQRVPSIAIAHFNNYVHLDKIRNRNARSLLVDYYEGIGDTDAASREKVRSKTTFPESSYTNRGKKALNRGNINQAEKYFNKALEINPIFVDAYANLATCLINRNQLDSALQLLKIADGLNPYNASTITNIGTVYLRQERNDEARRIFIEALRIDSTSINAMAGLASVYVKARDAEQLSFYLTKLNNVPEMSGEYFLQATKACIEADMSEQAKEAFMFAIRHGADQILQQKFMKEYPLLQDINHGSDLQKNPNQRRK